MVTMGLLYSDLSMFTIPTSLLIAKLVGRWSSSKNYSKNKFYFSYNNEHIFLRYIVFILVNALTIKSKNSLSNSKSIFNDQVTVSPDLYFFMSKMFSCRCHWKCWIRSGGSTSRSSVSWIFGWWSVFHKKSQMINFSLYQVWVGLKSD